MGRARDIANVLSSSTNIALDSELGLSLITPTSIATTGGSGSIGTTGSVSFTSASAISLNGCFNSTYDMYRITITTGDAATNQLFTMRMRSGITDNSNNTYYRTCGGTNIGGYTSITGAATSFALGYVGGTSNFTGSLDIYNPFSAYKVSIGGFSASNNSAYNGITNWSIGGWFDGTTSFDGFSLIFGANTTGTVRVYGYRN